MIRACAVVAAIVGAFAFAGCAPEASELGITQVEPVNRKAAPLIEGASIDGRQVSSADSSGRIVVVNLWASWCEPCRQEAPVLVDASRRHASDDVLFIGVVHNDTAARADAFNQEHGVAYPSILDQDGAIKSGFLDSLPAMALPTTWVIDRQGRVAARATTNELTSEMIDRMIDIADHH